MLRFDRERSLRRIVEYLQKLIAYPTAYPPGDSSSISRYLRGELAAEGYEPETFVSSPGLENVVARTGKGPTSLVFNAHIDTVGPGDLTLWRRDPFRGYLEDNRVFGLGAANCKASAAVQLWLAGELKKSRLKPDVEVTFTFVTDEESLNDGGTSHLREIGAIKPDMLLLGAPTDNTLIVAERGVLWVELTTFGKPAHAGQPEDGENAIEHMMRLLTVLHSELSDRLASRTADDMASTFNIGTIEGGANNNVVPARCTATLDRRLLPDETVDAAFAEIEQIVAESGLPSAAVKLERTRGTNGFRGAGDGPLVGALSDSIESVTGAPARFTTAIGVSDGRYFAGDDIEIVNFGPGAGTEGHAVDESVSLEALAESAEILVHCMNALVVG